MKMAVHFSAISDRWATPSDVYEALDREFEFNFDPCPLDGNEDGTARLFQSWNGKRVFCNPPYGPRARGFLERWRDAALAVYLLPARTDTKWFHEICLPHADEIRFIKGRLKFGDAQNSAPFPSMVVIFRAQLALFDLPDSGVTNPSRPQAERIAGGVA